jgi:hypothetical protein
MFTSVEIILSERYQIQADKEKGGKATEHCDVLGTVNLSGIFKMSEVNELVTALTKPYEQITIVHVEIKLAGTNE